MQGVLGNQEADDQAYALMQSALTLIPEGNWKEAAEALDQAAQIHAHAGRAYDQARCMLLSATLHRSAGDLSKARSLIERAAVVAPQDQPLAISIMVEQAETAFNQGRYQEAMLTWTAALEKVVQAALNADAMSALLRRRGATAVALNQLDQASADFDKAYWLLDTAQARDTALFVRVEQANLLWKHGYVDQAEQILRLLEVNQGENVSDALLFAEVFLLRARMARAADRIDAALDYARRSRHAALQAVAPVSYFAASAELSEALQILGDRSGAYGEMATAWVTLSDLLGKDTARAWVEPCLIAYQMRWGEPAFQQARNDYENRRRAKV